MTTRPVVRPDSTRRTSRSRASRFVIKMTAHVVQQQVGAVSRNLSIVAPAKELLLLVPVELFEDRFAP
jgi:hypothetical protein